MFPPSTLTETAERDVVLVLHAAVAALSLDVDLAVALARPHVALQVQGALRVAGAPLAALIVEAPVVALTLIALTPSCAEFARALARLNVT